MDRHQFVANPDPISHFNADPDSDPTSNFYTCWKVRNFYSFFTFNHNSASLHHFIFRISVTGVTNFNILDSALKFSVEKYSLSLHLVERDLDRQALRMSVRIC